MRSVRMAIYKSHEMPLAASLEMERCVWSSLFSTPDQREGLAAFLEHREPDFEQQ